jgi:HSP20 family molecular chaperone IbpA
MHSSNDNTDHSNEDDLLDSLSDEELDRLFQRMQQFFDSDEFKEIIEDIMYDVLSDDDEEDDESFYKPSFEENDEMLDSYHKPYFSIDDKFFEHYIEDNAPEVITSKTSVMVTISVPQARKNDINLHVTSDYVDITVHTRNQRYHRMVDLPVDVDPCSTKATFTNGVLDIVMRKTSPHNKGCKISLS